jgi:excisionase family DNA binding protein
MTERLTVKEAAAVMGVSEKTVRRLIDQRELTCIRRPRCTIRIPADAIEEYEARYLCPAKPAPHGSPR